jgi:uncharacterized membrane protein (UPF0127 family)
MRRLLFFLPLLLFFLAACGGGGSQEPPKEERLPEIPFRKDGTLTFLRDGAPLVTIDIEIADDDSTRTRGLMQRSSLPERSGMLFIFDQAAPQSFWMANTRLPLDILFVDADSQIVSITKYTKPLSPESVTSGGAAARFVIEVEAGFTDTYGIIETDRVRWVDLREKKEIG